MDDQRLKVLLIEDDEDDYILTREYLAETRGNNFELNWVEDYDAGLEAIRQNQHDVYLVDYRLGKNSGLDLLRTAVAHGCLSPIILLTGLGDHLVDSDAMRSGAADYLVKGQFDAQQLERSIRHSLLRKRAERDLHQQLTRISLLNQITHAISERMDLENVLNVVLGQLEIHLPVDYGSVFLFDAQAGILSQAASRRKSLLPTAQLISLDQLTVPLAEAGLVACSTGELLYEPEIAKTQAPLLKRLTQTEMGSAVVVPMMVERNLFGVLIAARAIANGFSIGECEFLRTLCEHVALAAHQARLHTQLQSAYDELRQTHQAVMQHERLRALGQMASGIAHDINNALSPVSGFAELLLRNEKNLSETARRYLHHIKTASDDVAHIVTRMRDFYRKREEHQPLLPVNLNQLSQQVVELTRPRWRDISQQRGISMEVQHDADPHLPEIIGMESELREALTNLIFNALDAMPRGGVIILRTRVGAWAHRHGGAKAPSHVVLEVIDTGVGMDEQTRKHCLEPFFSTKGQLGTGLGLAMVYGVVQRHEGAIEIESAPGKGTTMRLIFPVREAAPGESGKDAATAAPVSPMRILFIDDEPLLRELLKEILECDGHQVQIADGGWVGLDVFRAANKEGRPFDVVITDLGMPHLDGRQLAQIIKKESPATPIIMMTGWATSMKGEEEVPLGVDGVLNKPPNIAELQGMLRQLAQRRHSSRAR
ncbi:MAG TPA: response regulator [Haliangiales bacterium]|nr:response regulator [Haliangiales bacterium]